MVTIGDMSKTYTKLFESILDSTVWQEPLPTKVTWLTMMAMADRDGVVSASVPGLAHRAGVTIEECEVALAKFQEPDPYSRTKDHEGRRVEAVDGGWLLLNHAKYRAMMSAEDRREYQRLKQADYRARKKGKAPTGRERRFESAIAAGDEAAADRIAAEGLPENGAGP
jgi:hypothetical protein